MPQTAIWRDFKSGWIPSDDSISGRKDGLLSMDNLELDRNGALSLAGGTQKVGTQYPSTAHTLYSRYIAGTRQDYVSCVNGNTYRNNASIMVGGDSARTAFSSAFDYTLICSGPVRKKDRVNLLYDLGIAAPTAGPTVDVATTIRMTSGVIFDTAANFGTLVNLNGTSVLGGGPLGKISMTTNHIHGAGADIYVASCQSYNDPTAPHDMFRTAVHGPRFQGTDDDFIPITVSSPVDIMAKLSSFRIDFLLSPGNAAGAVVLDYFTYVWINDGTFPGGQLNLRIRRTDFQRVGGQTQLDWTNVYGIRLTLISGAPGTYDITNSYTSTTYGTKLAFQGGDESTLSGSYEYACINVFNTGSYLARSELGPITATPRPLDMDYTIITPQNPTPLDSSVNEVWLFRRGGDREGGLQQWYRVLVFSVATTGSLTAAHEDHMKDQDAIDLDIIVNLNLVSIASSSITDPVLAIVGPIEGRWFYFTTNMMYPSDINNPDLVDASIAVRTTGSNSEIFLWAKKISDAAVLIGTSHDIYLLTGTFQTLPDFTVDIYYRSTGSKYPPISADCAVFEGTAFYMASDGWRLATPAIFSTTYGGGANSSVVVPNVDRLYGGISCYGYSAPNLLIASGSVRFPVAIAKNKLWCGITGTNRVEVYDFARKYWRATSRLALGDISAITNTPDGQILAFFPSDRFLRIIDKEGTNLLIDGTTKQPVTIISPVFDGAPDQPMPRNRKDFYTLKARIMTQGDPLSIVLIDENGVAFAGGNISSNAIVPTEEIIDISGFPISRTWQYQMSGNFQNFVLSDISIDFDARPAPLTFLRLYNNNFGNASKKRVRVWPQVIDTLGGSAAFKPFVDNVAQTVTNLTTTDKTTALVFFKTDVFGIDYGAEISGGPFEYWGELTPDIVQILPIARRFDQVGPQELFKYGRIKQFELRVLPINAGLTSDLPFRFIFNDNTQISGSITVVNGSEASYFLGVPKGTGGTIIRIELGPTNYDFHRYYMRLQVMPSGRDTELEWITLPGGDR